MSNIIRASVSVVLTCVKGHFIDHLFLLGVKTTEKNVTEP